MKKIIYVFFFCFAIVFLLLIYIIYDQKRQIDKLLEENKIIQKVEEPKEENMEQVRSEVERYLESFVNNSYTKNLVLSPFDISIASKEEKLNYVLWLLFEDGKMTNNDGVSSYKEEDIDAYMDSYFNLKDFTKSEDYHTFLSKNPMQYEHEESQNLLIEHTEHMSGRYLPISNVEITCTLLEVINEGEEYQAKYQYKVLDTNQLASISPEYETSKNFTIVLGKDNYYIKDILKGE